MQSDIIDDVDAWSSKYLRYRREYFDEENSDNSSFSARLGQFLYSPRGGRYRERFSFEGTAVGSADGEVVCGEEAPRLLLAEVTFTHKVSTCSTYVRRYLYVYYLCF